MLQDGMAARHAFRVASGLDSMVLGEAQILGQMKDAVRAAEHAGALGTTLNQLFQRSFAVAKEVRSATEIGAHSISMAAAAVRLAGQLFEDLTKVRVLFVGAGEMIELAATHFAARNPAGIAVANRTLERGEKLASRFGGQVMRLADLPAGCTSSTSWSAPRPASCPSSAWAPSNGRSRRASTVRCSWSTWPCRATSSPRSRRWRTCTCTRWTTWPRWCRPGQANRQAAVAQAEAIIDAGVQSFLHWMDQRGTVPLIQQLNAQADEWRTAELARARKLLAKGENVDEVLEALSKGLTQKMLHGAMAELHAGDAAARERAGTAIQHFFLRNKGR
jgi:glutamyl-tRNA reductase